MSLEKAIKHGKEHRKEYLRPYTKSCLNHGGCPHCLENRMHKYEVHTPIVEDEEKFEYLVYSNSIN